MKKKLSLSSIFLLCCLIGVLLTFLGLRFYYHHTTLTSVLMTEFAANKFEVTAGKGQLLEGDLLITETDANNQSETSLKNLYIDTRFYETVNISFTQKDNLQPLNLIIYYQDGRIEEQPILYTNDMTSHLFFKGHGVISKLDLTANKLFMPYSIHDISFQPKRLSNFEFAQLIISSLGQAQSPNKKMMSEILTQPALLPNKLLILLYFSIVGALFFTALFFKKRRLLPIWWIILISAWLVLDALNLLEISKAQFTQLVNKKIDLSVTKASPAALTPYDNSQTKENASNEKSEDDSKSDINNDGAVNSPEALYNAKSTESTKKTNSILRADSIEKTQKGMSNQVQTISVNIEANKQNQEKPKP